MSESEMLEKTRKQIFLQSLHKECSPHLDFRCLQYYKIVIVTWVVLGHYVCDICYNINRNLIPLQYDHKFIFFLFYGCQRNKELELIHLKKSIIQLLLRTENKSNSWHILKNSSFLFCFQRWFKWLQYILVFQNWITPGGLQD